MNKIHKSQYNESLGTWVAVPEIAKGRGKSATVAKDVLTTSSSLPKFAISALTLALLQVMSVSAYAADTDYGKGNGEYVVESQAVKFKECYSVNGTFSCGFRSTATQIKSSSSTAVGSSIYAGMSTAVGNNILIGKTDDPVKYEKVYEEAQAQAKLKAEAKSKELGLEATEENDRFINKYIKQYVKEHVGEFIEPANFETAKDSVAVGSNIAINTPKTVAIGTNIKQTEKNSVFLGNESGYIENEDISLGNKKGTNRQVKLAEGTTYADVDGVVSVASGKNTRRIQGVAPGLVRKNSSDAINGAQLDEVYNQIEAERIRLVSVIGGNATAPYTDSSGKTENIFFNPDDKKFYKLGSEGAPIAATVNTGPLEKQMFGGDGDYKKPTFTVYTDKKRENVYELKLPKTNEDEPDKVKPAVASNVGDALANLNDYVNEGIVVKVNGTTSGPALTPTRAINFKKGEYTTATVKNTDKNGDTTVTFDINADGIKKITNITNNAAVQEVAAIAPVIYTNEAKKQVIFKDNKWKFADGSSGEVDKDKIKISLRNPDEVGGNTAGGPYALGNVGDGEDNFDAINKRQFDYAVVYDEPTEDNKTSERQANVDGYVAPDYSSITFKGKPVEPEDDGRTKAGTGTQLRNVASAGDIKKKSHAGYAVNAGDLFKATKDLEDMISDNITNINNNINNKTLGFVGDDGKKVSVKLDNSLNLKGGAKADELSDDNIGIVQGSGSEPTLNVKLSKNIKGLESIELGDKKSPVKIDGNGIAIGKDGKDGKGVSLTKDGLDNGGNVIKNVAAGKEPTDAVNVAQLNDTISKSTYKGWNLSVDGKGETTIESGYKVNLVSAANGSDKHKNIVINPSKLPGKKQTDVTFDLANDLRVDSVSTGKAKLDGKGLVIGRPEDDDAIKVTDAGIHAGNKKVTGVKDGEIAPDSKDAINGSQLHAQGDAIKKIIGGDGKDNPVSYDPKAKTPFIVKVEKDKDGNPIRDKNGNPTSGLGDTGQSNVHDAIKWVRNQKINTYEAGDNIHITPPNDEGIRTISTKEKVEFNSITVYDKGDDGKKKPVVVINKDGINAGNKKITNVADGRVTPDSTDAVNGRQLYSVRNDLNEMDKRARSGIASAMASAGLPQAYLPGKSMVGAAASNYRGETAIAVGVSTISDNGKWLVKADANANRKDFGVSLGVGYQW